MFSILTNVYCFIQININTQQRMPFKLCDLITDLAKFISQLKPLHTMTEGHSTGLLTNRELSLQLRPSHSRVNPVTLRMSRVRTFISL
jgi:hypothetical protein